MSHRTDNTFLSYETCKSLADFVSKDPARPTLQKVHLTRDHAEASNGHIMLRVELRPGYKAEASHALDVSALKAVKRGECLGIDPVDKVVWIGPEPACYVDEARILLQGVLTSETFPNFDQIFPIEEDDDFRVAFSGEYLKRLGATAKRYSRTTGRLTFRFRREKMDDGSYCWGVAFSIPNPGDGAVKGVIAPLRPE